MSNLTKKFAIGLLPAALAVCLALPGSAALRFQDPQDAPQPDNSKKNLPTNHADANRADQQSNNSSDVELTRKIRQAVVKDKSLSTYAHNIKIITRNGVVELKGPVRSQEEKDAIAAKVTDLAGGAANVKNNLTVKGS